MKTHTLTLELLRHGPSNNQLLSPLTLYLALCGTHDAETLQIGMEQAEANRRIRGLRYEDGPRGAAVARVEAAEKVSRIFGDIRALLAELSSAAQRDRGLVHLRLVISASELSMLPFELSTSPPGFPGQGQPLLLQTITPVVLTRELRRTGATALRWPVRPKILIVVASPPLVGEVPMAAHVAAISEALAPWLVTRDRDGLAQYITVIPRASLARVREACAATAFTHVHILAHGYATTDPADRELMYGLAFHAEGNEAEMDVVSGSRLASALRSHRADGGDGGLSCPTVVTVASCDSGNVGSVVTPGADVAHALHEAGIPLVLASQFPLTQRGSVVLAQTIYPRLLRGEDPRLVVHAMRQALQVDCPDGHDWASVTVYAALPEDVGAEVRRARFESVKRMVDAALARLDKGEEAIQARKEADRAAGAPSVEETEAERQQKAASQAALGAVIAELERVLPDDDQPHGSIRWAGALASAKKRFAHTFFRRPLWPLLSTMARGEDGPKEVDIEAQRRARSHLEEAREHYKEAFRINGSQAWTLVQYLALWAALEPLKPRDPQETPRPDPAHQREYEAYWTTAHTIAHDNLSSLDPQKVVWAHGALLELAVLAQLLPEAHPACASAAGDAEMHMERLLSTAESRLDAYSMRRQLQRYADWWWLDRPDLRALPLRLATTMLAYGVPRTLNAT